MGYVFTPSNISAIIISPAKAYRLVRMPLSEKKESEREEKKKNFFW